MLAVLCVGMGGFIGSVGRYLLGLVPVEGDFPLMTFIINFAGAVLIGAARSTQAARSPNDARCTPAEARASAVREEASSWNTHVTFTCAHIDASTEAGMRGESGTVTARSHEAATCTM